MNPAYHFASGNSVYTGTALLLAGLVMQSTPRFAVRKSLARVLCATGLLFIVLSTSPLPLLLYAAWALALLQFWWGIRRRDRLLSDMAEGAAALRNSVQADIYHRRLPCVLLVSMSCCACELLATRHPGRWIWKHLYGAPSVGTATSLHVVGDSLSALSPSPWPEILAANHGILVVNHARAGATAQSAWQQADAIPTVKRCLVLIEIGGNDLLSFHSPTEFRHQLRRLLQKLEGGGHDLVMLELPLLPGFYAYGYAQRELAKELHVELIPKRELAAVLARDRSADGLHLSPHGHEMLARRLEPFLLPYLRR
jgi:lysophospholipase L1-like esterase